MNMQTLPNQTTPRSKSRLSSFLRYLRRDYLLYLMIVPGMAYILIFKYWPMYGVTIAFRDYNIFTGFTNAAWVGFRQFRRPVQPPGFHPGFEQQHRDQFPEVDFRFPGPDHPLADDQ
jgi:putative aldouronate transport system permease protein